MEKINITIFAGGTGNQELLGVLNKISWINVNIVTNCYDDGKSTGRLRHLIRGMLGPSDIRKNISNLLNQNNYENRILKKILEFRLPDNSFNKFYNDFINKKGEINQILNILPKKKSLILENYIYIFLKLFSKVNKIEKDISLGNIILSGIFIKTKNFNLACKIFNYIFLNQEQVHNVTDGQNLFLIALREDGKITYEEGDLVCETGNRIKEIFLINKKFSTKEKILLNKMNFSQKLKILSKKQIIPKINKKLNLILKKSDIIIYGPGTQHSSLYPSYMTKNIYDYIKNSKAVKFFIGNIYYDYDIINQNIEDLIKNFFYYASCKKKIPVDKAKLVNYYFINNFDKEDINNSNKQNYVKLVKNLNNKNFKFLDWEKKEGVHYPGLLLKQLINLSKKKYFINKLSNYFFTVSIIIPCLNENKTILKTLQKINNLNLDKYNLTKEIIVVDGGSHDGSIEKIKKFKFCKFFISDKPGKGEAIKTGIKKARGDIIAFFPADEEYDTEDLEKAINQILNKNPIVYGNRNVKMVNLSKNIRKIYNNNKIEYLISKYGGMVLSIMCLIFFNRYISDSLTSIKVFKSNILKKLNLISKGFDIELEITSKILKSQNPILEIPVNYRPRSKKNGKKITFIDGINCILVILKNLFSKKI